jgi:hypothetical protein
MVRKLVLLSMASGTLVIVCCSCNIIHGVHKRRRARNKRLWMSAVSRYLAKSNGAVCFTAHLNVCCCMVFMMRRCAVCLAPPKSALAFGLAPGADLAGTLISVVLLQDMMGLYARVCLICLLAARTQESHLLSCIQISPFAIRLHNARLHMQYGAFTYQDMFALQKQGGGVQSTIVPCTRSETTGLGAVLLCLRGGWESWT